MIQLIEERLRHKVLLNELFIISSHDLNFSQLLLFLFPISVANFGDYSMDNLFRSFIRLLNQQTQTILISSPHLLLIKIVHSRCCLLLPRRIFFKGCPSIWFITSFGFFLNDSCCIVIELQPSWKTYTYVDSTYHHYYLCRVDDLWGTLNQKVSQT